MVKFIYLILFFGNCTYHLFIEYYKYAVKTIHDSADLNNMYSCQIIYVLISIK